MRRVVLDTNVWVSAILFGGKPAQLHQLALRGEILPALSAALKDELEGVLIRKFRFPESVVDTILTEIIAMSFSVYPVEEISEIKDDAADNRVLECAISAKAEAIISGDRHLLRLGSFREIPILSPQAFLSRFLR